LIASGVNAVKGDVSKKDEMRAQMRKADYASVRGPYKYGNNQFPIQNFYLQEAVATGNGNYALKTVATAMTAHQDRYHDRCPMKW
jgi:branched-chain amino acid transport system substrate-binding protein